MILLVDNYDSFAYNLYQLIGSIDPNIKVIRNDEMTVGEAFGSTITYAKELMHGKSSIIKMTDDLIFQGLKQQTKVARYHSLAVKRETLAKVLKAIALSEDGEVMAVKHIDYPVYGLQFHPESILTDDGKKMIENFLGVKEND